MQVMTVPMHADEYMGRCTRAHTAARDRLVDTGGGPVSCTQVSKGAPCGQTRAEWLCVVTWFGYQADSTISARCHE